LNALVNEAAAKTVRVVDEPLVEAGG